MGIYTLIDLTIWKRWRRMHHTSDKLFYFTWHVMHYVSWDRQKFFEATLVFWIINDLCHSLIMQCWYFRPLINTQKAVLLRKYISNMYITICIYILYIYIYVCVCVCKLWNGQVNCALSCFQVFQVFQVSFKFKSFKFQVYQVSSSFHSNWESRCLVSNALMIYLHSETTLLRRNIEQTDAQEKCIFSLPSWFLVSTYWLHRSVAKLFSRKKERHNPVQIELSNRHKNFSQIKRNLLGLYM